MPESVEQGRVEQESDRVGVIPFISWIRSIIFEFILRHVPFSIVSRKILYSKINYWNL